MNPDSDLAERKRVAVEVDAPASLPTVRVDRGRAVQVLVNLMENAIQHSPEGRPVNIRVESCAPAGVSGVQFRVEDHGSGFQTSDLPRVFEPFFTRRQGGTGLGLAIVRRIVGEHGGTIIPANRSGGGASVSVWLPLKPPEEPRPATGAESREER
jgi:signal transduction histidine kinase